MNMGEELSTSLKVEMQANEPERVTAANINLYWDAEMCQYEKPPFFWMNLLGSKG
jgi:hypothetical protein